MIITRDSWSGYTYEQQRTSKTELLNTSKNRVISIWGIYFSVCNLGTSRVRQLSRDLLSTHTKISTSQDLLTKILLSSFLCSSMTFPELVPLPTWFIPSSHMLLTEICLCTSWLISEESDILVLSFLMALIKSSLSYSLFDMVFTGLLIISCDHPVKVGMKATCQLGTRKAGDGFRKHTLSRFYPMRLINIHFTELSQLDSWSCVDQSILP